MYSFGVVCYEVLTRSRPFQGITGEIELAHKLHTGQGLDVHLLPAEVSPTVCEMIGVCLRICIACSLLEEAMNECMCMYL